MTLAKIDTIRLTSKQTRILNSCESCFSAGHAFLSYHVQPIQAVLRALFSGSKAAGAPD
jgi:hypothetical protein